MTRIPTTLSFSVWIPADRVSGSLEDLLRDDEWIECEACGGTGFDDPGNGDDCNDDCDECAGKGGLWASEVDGG